MILLLYSAQNILFAYDMSFIDVLHQGPKVAVGVIIPNS